LQHPHSFRKFNVRRIPQKGDVMKILKLVGIVAAVAIPVALILSNIKKEEKVTVGYPTLDEIFEEEFEAS
jgi:hypothetical protein